MGQVSAFKVILATRTFLVCLILIFNEKLPWNRKNPGMLIMMIFLMIISFSGKEVEIIVHVY